MRPSKLTPKQEKYVCENLEVMTMKEIADQLKVPYHYVYWYARSLGCKRTRDFTQEEDDFLRLAFGRLNTNYIAEYLGCSYYTVYNRACTLGLKSKINKRTKTSVKSCI